MDLSNRRIRLGSSVFVVRGLLLQFVPRWELIDFLGYEVVFNHLATRELCVFQGRLELFNLPLQSLSFIL